MVERTIKFPDFGEFFVLSPPKKSNHTAKAIGILAQDFTEKHFEIIPKVSTK